jgi:DNA-binding transcriptional ArsR family regulator
MLKDAERRRRVEVFASLANEARLRIVEMLVQGTLECQEIRGEITLSQPAVSYHLAKLERAGVVVKEKRGTRNCYRLSSDLGFPAKMLK